MRLPASQYSVLDAKKIERLDDDTFMCYVGGLNFLGFVVEPVLTVSVIVQDRGPVVRLLDTKVLTVFCNVSVCMQQLLLPVHVMQHHIMMTQQKIFFVLSLDQVKSQALINMMVCKCSLRGQKLLLLPMTALLPQ